MQASLTFRFLNELLPPDAAAALRRHLTGQDAAVQAYGRLVASQAQRALAATRPYLHHSLHGLVALAADNQGLAGGLALLALLASLLIVLGWIRRLLLWWTRFAFSLLFCSLFVLLAAWIGGRGVFQSVKDVVVVTAKVAGYLDALKNVWLDEYRRYQNQQQHLHQGAARDRRWVR